MQHQMMSFCASCMYWVACGSQSPIKMKSKFIDFELILVDFIGKLKIHIEGDKNIETYQMWWLEAVVFNLKRRNMHILKVSKTRFTCDPIWRGEELTFISLLKSVSGDWNSEASRFRVVNSDVVSAGGELWSAALTSESASSWSPPADEREQAWGGRPDAMDRGGGGGADSGGGGGERDCKPRQ